MEFFSGYSTKADGSMYLSVDGFDPENEINRKRYFDSIGCRDLPVVSAGLVHGTSVSDVRSGIPSHFKETDALVTDKPGVILTLTGADCFPVYFEDRLSNIVGIAHAGWRGIVHGIIPQTIDRLVSLGSKPERLNMHIGPGICADHFEIRRDILPFFSTFHTAVREETSPVEKVTVDLKRIILRQAATAGISANRISESTECTCCLQEKYFSYRRDRPETIQAQVAYIGMRQ
ncbi:MAG: peptidoglycan editing factor PgeF [Candidatus Moraniibacteriota bacterium]